MRRRRLLGGAGLAALAAAAGAGSALGASGGSDGSEEAAATPLPTVKPPPTVAPPPPHFEFAIALLASDKVPAHANLSTTSAYQGGAVMVVVNNAREAKASILGRNYVLQGDNDLADIIGFGTEDPPGATRVVVQATDLTGAAQSWELPLTVLRTQWTRDTIILPPPEPPPPRDPSAPPPPPPPPDETPLLPKIYAGVTPKMWNGPWVAPVPDLSNITSYFGEQRAYSVGAPFQGHHSGTDIGVASGVPISATNSGTVVLSGLYSVRGNLVIVDHGQGVFSGYGHMRERVAQVGQVVTKGQLLGYVGSTGQATGPHLHWEISVLGLLVDGLRWLDGTQGF